MSTTRHRRIHEAQQDGQPVLANDDELENEVNDFESPGEESLLSDHTHNMISTPAMTTSMSIASAIPAMVPPHMIAPQLLQQRI